MKRTVPCPAHTPNRATIHTQGNSLCFGGRAFISSLIWLPLPYPPPLKTRPSPTTVHYYKSPLRLASLYAHPPTYSTKRTILRRLGASSSSNKHSISSRRAILVVSMLSSCNSISVSLGKTATNAVFFRSGHVKPALSIILIELVLAFLGQAFVKYGGPFVRGAQLHGVEAHFWVAAFRARLVHPGVPTVPAALPLFLVLVASRSQLLVPPWRRLGRAGRDNLDLAELCRACIEMCGCGCGMGSVECVEQTYHERWWQTCRRGRRWGLRPAGPGARGIRRRKARPRPSTCCWGVGGGFLGGGGEADGVGRRREVGREIRKEAKPRPLGPPSHTHRPYAWMLPSCTRAR